MYFTKDCNLGGSREVWGSFQNSQCWLALKFKNSSSKKIMVDVEVKKGTLEKNSKVLLKFYDTVGD